ncbi:MAG: FAD binding domain-containing protein, partial [Pseudomonadota bacterium]
MHNTTYHKASSAAEAASLLSGADDGALLAGGQTLIPTMKQRLAAPSDLVDISGVAEMQGISVAESTVTIGAMTTHAEVASSAELRSVCPGLADLAGHIGDPAVRHKGTLGGSVANNDPAADYPAAMLALGATIKTDKREIAADDFFQGMFTTALDEGEMIVSVSFDAPEKGAYAKFPNPASRYAMCGVFVAKGAGGVRVAVTGAGEDGVFRSA